MNDLTFGCISATPFNKDGIDEEALRGHLNRLIDSKISVYLGSGGNGESHAMTPQELSRVYKIGVEECKGKVQIQSHLPEECTPRAMREQADIAIAAGIELVQVYTPEARHGFIPTPDELSAYYDLILTGLNHPVGLVVSKTMGSMPRVEQVVAICKKHRQIQAVLLAHTPDTYLMDLKNLINWDMKYIVQFMTSSLNALAAGADGMFSAEVNTLPKTGRKFISAYQAKQHDEVNIAFSELTRFRRHVQKWAPASARWIKMAMKVLKLPGGNGVIRPPYLMPKEEELQRFLDGLLAMRIREIDEIAGAAGLTLPN